MAINKMKCFNCGGIGLENHHVVPKSKGGTKTVVLCSDCHGKIHGINRLNISELTKAALKARKERVGEWRKGVITDEARKKAVETNKRKAATNENNIRATDIAKMYRENGLSLPQIADQLNKAKFRTSRDCQFTPMSVKRLIEK